MVAKYCGLGDMKRVAVLGLDALSWGYLEKLAKGGVIPTIKHLYTKYLRARLEAMPPVTPPSWSSIMTGVNPGKHGIYFFYKYIKDDSGWRQRLSSAYDLGHPRIHEMLGFHRRRSIVFNPIPDYPIIPVPGSTVISNLFFTPKPMSYPHEAIREYFGDPDINEYLGSGCESVKSYVSVIVSYQAAIEKAVRKEPQLLWVNLNIPDTLMHRCPRMLEEGFVAGERKVFSVVDSIAKLLWESFDMLVIVSDHGFAKYSRLVSVNDILVKEGYAIPSPKKFDLALTAKERDHAAIEERDIQVSPTLIRLTKKLRLKKPAKALLKLIANVTGKRVKAVSSKWVDVERSRAFFPSHSYFGILFNDASTRDRLYHILVSKYSEYLRVYKREDMYRGPYVKEAPPLVVIPNVDNGCWFNPPYLVGTVSISDTIYQHHPEGVFIAADDSGALARGDAGRIPNRAVAQIILCYMGLPLPTASDKFSGLGKIIECASKPFDYLPRWRIMKQILMTRHGRFS